VTPPRRSLEEIMNSHRMTPLVCRVAGLVLAALFAGQVAWAQQAAADALVQMKRLKERDRLRAEVNRLRQQGKLAEAVVAVEKVLAIERAALGKTHADVADSLELLAELHEEREDFTAARTMRQEALALRRQLHGDGHWRVTDAQLAVADTERLARLDPAQRQRLGAANRLEMQVVALFQQGKFSEAIRSAQQILRIRKEMLGEKHPDYARSLFNLAAQHHSRGDYARAEPLYQQALAITKQALGDHHPAYAISLHNLAGLFLSEADYARAEPLYRQAMKIYRHALGEKHPAYARSLSSLAVLYHEMGDYARADPLLRQALAIRKEVLGEQHPDYARSLHSLANLYLSQGDEARAEPLLRQALAIKKQTLGEQHLHYAASLLSLARLYFSQGDYAHAEPLYLQALAITEQALGKHHPDYIGALSDLAALYDFQKHVAVVEPFLRQALATTKQKLGEHHPDYAACLNNLARLYWSQGDYARAKPLLGQASEILKETLGDQHPDYASSLINLAWLSWSEGDIARAEFLLRQSLRISRGNLDLAAAVQAERQQLVMNDMLRHNLDAYLTLAVRAQKAGEPAYGHVLAWKGAVFARQQRVRWERQHPELAADFARLERTTSQLAQLALAAPASSQGEAYRRQLQQLTEDKERQESDLAQKSAAFRQQQARARLSPAQVQALLPKDAALIDFLEYTDFTPSPKSKGKLDREWHLAAFVVRPGLLEQLDLGPVRPITAAIDRWRQAVSRQSADQELREAGTELRRRLWQPLTAHLQGVGTVLVSPDGAVARLPLAALPGSRPDAYLIEELAIAVVPVPQLLPELLAAQPGTDKAEPSLLLVGDVDYGAVPGLVDEHGGSRSAARGSRAGVLPAYGALAATREEIVAVRDSFEQRFAAGHVRALRRDQATETAVRVQAPRHRYLHFATHGFFAPPELRSALAPAAERSGRPGRVSDDFFGQRGVSGWHPGLLSGLVLAGANRPPLPEQDDGVLTALEVAQLDLSDVELAVLSACETGLGEVAGGEGLLGLQRAFQVAGARSVVASLWKVDDDASRQLMVRLYENLWRTKQPLGKLEALRQAQLAMLREGRKRGPGAARPVDPEALKRAVPMTGRTPPFYWAAFVLSGDWR
jgi:CHAT domain-containing protein/Tfp pilus assembly protein PilF